MTDDFLPALYPVYGGIGNYPQGIKKYPLDAVLCCISVGSGVVGNIFSLSGWKFIVR